MKPSNSLVQLPFPLNAEDPQPVCDGLTWRWIFDRRAFMFTASNSSRLVIDGWFDKMCELLDTLPEPIYSIHDFSAKDCLSTPYGRGKNLELGKKYDDKTIVLVSVLQKGMTLEVSKAFVRFIPNISSRVYLTHDLQDGLLWLTKKM